MIRALSILLLMAACQPGEQIGHNDLDAAVDAAGSPWSVELQDSAIALSAVWGSGPTDIYAVGIKGNACLILHSTGDGQWVEQPTGINGGLFSIWGSGPNDIYAGGFGNTLLHSTGNGVWTLQTIPNLGVSQIWGSGPNDVYITYANSGGMVHHSTGNGVWTALAIGDAGSTISTVWGTSATNVYFAGGIGTGFRTPYVVHGPANPTAQTMPTFPDMFLHDVFEVFGNGPNDVYAVGNGFAIYHSDGGGTWTLQATPQSGNVFLDTWASGPDDVYAVSDSGGAYHSTGDGMWTRDPDVLNQPHAIWGSSKTDVYVVGSAIMHKVL
jgi:hypothetical protein